MRARSVEVVRPFELAVPAPPQTSDTFSLRSGHGTDE